MDYFKAQALVEKARNKTSKPIANNTWCELDGENYSVRLHGTDILTFKPDGSIIVRTGGWNTVTTKARLNDYLDWPRVFSERGVWMISSGDVDYLFESGMEIKPDGTIDGQPIFAEKLEKFTKKSIPTYNDLIKAIKELSIDEMIKAWKKFKRDRTLLAKYCRADFLPLTLGTERANVYGGMYYQDEGWRQIVSERLRTAS